MTIARTSFVTLLGIGMMLAAGSMGCGGSSAPPPATGTTPAGKSASTMDSDDDGIFDDVDLCPNEKEDGKGAAPKDGCPDGKGKT
jgi:hypothetical protein